MLDMKRKKAEIKPIVVIVVLAVVLVILIAGLYYGWWGQIVNLGSITGEENIQPVVARCELLCFDKVEATEYCVASQNPLPLRLGNGKTIEGSCAALSELGTLAIDGYDGISECKDITCSNIEPAVCKDGGREVDCALFKEEGFLSS